MDVGGSLALASKGLYATGVSTDINISYISSAKEGDVVTVVSICQCYIHGYAYVTMNLGLSL